MPEAPLFDADFFRTAQRSIPVPFRIDLVCNGRPATLVCHEIVRVVPGKRIVGFSEWNGTPIAIKLFLQRRRSRRHYSRELGGLNALENIGVKAPNVVFTGGFQSGDLPVLGLERVQPAQNLESLWEETPDDDTRQELLGRVIGVIAKQHAAGIRQDDLHFGNYLFKGDEIYTVDGNAVNKKDKGKPLSPRKSLKNLALFFAQVPPVYDRWVPGLFDLYTRKRAWAIGSETFTRQLLGRLKRELGRRRRHRKRALIQKITRECTAYTIRHQWRLFRACRRDRLTGAMEELLSAPDRFMGGGRVLKNGNSSTVSLVELEGRRLVVKRYNIKNPWHGLKRCLRRSRARKSWHNAHLLKLLGISTPEPVAFLERRWGPFSSTAYYITDYVAGPDVGEVLAGAEDDPAARQRIMDGFAELLTLCREGMVSHGDFKATNFLFSQGRIYLCDLDGMREHRLPWGFRRAFQRDCRRLLKNWSASPATRELVGRLIDRLNRQHP